MKTLGDSFFRKILHRALDVVYPPDCEICQTPLKNGIHICQTCIDELPRIKEPFCERCGEMFEGNIKHNFTCPNCSKLHYDFAFNRPVLVSSEPARLLIHRLKYGRAIYLAADLAHIAAEAFLDPRLQQAGEEKWTLIPVPLHWKREQKRHFNQSLEVARHLARQLNLPYCNALKRVRKTTTQTALNRRDRLKNLKKSITISFKGKRWLRKRPMGVIILDDVFTTGATTQECSSVLRKNGVENIVVVTLMRG